MKEGIFIKVISKNEAFILRQNGFSKDVHNGHGTYHIYMVTENPKTLKFLEQFRESIKVK